MTTSLVDLFKHSHALFDLADSQGPHTDHVLVQIGKVYLLKARVVSHCIVHERMQVVIEALKQLNSLNLPHFLHFYVVEGIVTWYLTRACLPVPSRLLSFEEFLEDDDVEFPIVSLGHLGQ